MNILNLLRKPRCVMTNLTAATIIAIVPQVAATFIRAFCEATNIGDKS